MISFSRERYLRIYVLLSLLCWKQADIQGIKVIDKFAKDNAKVTTRFAQDDSKFHSIGMSCRAGLLSAVCQLGDAGRGCSVGGNKPAISPSSTGLLLMFRVATGDGDDHSTSSAQLSVDTVSWMLLCGADDLEAVQCLHSLGGVHV